VCWAKRSLTCARVSCGGREGVPPPARTQPPPPRPWYHRLNAIALLRGVHQTSGNPLSCHTASAHVYAKTRTCDTQCSSRNADEGIVEPGGHAKSYNSVLCVRQVSLHMLCSWTFMPGTGSSCRCMDRCSLVRAGWQEVVLGPRVAARVPLLRPGATP